MLGLNNFNDGSLMLISSPRNNNGKSLDWNDINK
jgi:hypothetical protein